MIGLVKKLFRKEKQPDPHEDWVLHPTKIFKMIPKGTTTNMEYDVPHGLLALTRMNNETFDRLPKESKVQWQKLADPYYEPL